MDKPVYDLDTLEPVKVETEKKETPPEPESKKTDEKEEEKEEPAEKEEEKEEEFETPEAEKKSEDEGSKETETEEKKEEEEEESPVKIDDFLKSKYEEKYEIKSEADLDDILDHVSGLVEYNETLEAKNKELTEQLASKEGKLVFKSEAQESLYNFVKDYDPSKIHTGIQTWARLVGMDVAKEPARLVLEEQFILDNPDLSREDAQRKFSRDFNKKYAPPARESFETDAEFEEEKEMREIDMKADAAKARKLLLEKQKEFKKEPPKTEEKKVEEVPVAVTSAIKQMATELDTQFKDFSELIFSPTNSEADNFTFGLSKEQKAEVYKVMKPWIENPASYDAKGKFVAGDLMRNVTAAAFTLFGIDMIAEAYKAGQNKGEVKKADALAKRQPDRKAKAAGENPLGQLSEEKQWEMALQKKRATQKVR